MKIHIGIPSSGRPHNIWMMEEKFKGWQEPVWYVHESEAMEYQVGKLAAVAMDKDIYTLTKTRNLIIDDAQIQGAWCVQIDDDLRGLQVLDRNKGWKPITVQKTIELIIHYMKKTGAKLGGLAPTDNKMFARNAYERGGPCRDTGYICSLMVIAPDNHLRFDEQLATKEDYDYCLANVKEFGKLVRINNVIQSFSHYTQKGGFGPIRNDNIEESSVLYLKKKWGDCIGTNTKRKGVEIRIAKWPS